MPKSFKDSARISSILKTSNLDPSLSDYPIFDLSELKHNNPVSCDLPSNLRLGHIIEKVVVELIKASDNYQLLYESVQLIDNKKTIGELDFIIREIETQKVIHLELAYKFYLYDSSISDNPINNWIGPNRNDKLSKKLEKLKRKQFPLLYHPFIKSMLHGIDIDQVTQVLCFLVSLYVPYDNKDSFEPIYRKAIKGYYLNLETFNKLDHTSKSYYIPSKIEWGMDPSENKTWTNLKEFRVLVKTFINEKRAPLCWQKCGDSYSEFFVVWW